MESILVLILVGILAYLAIKIVPEYQRLVVLRLGRSIGPRGPGVVWLWPYLDKGLRVDLREIFLEIPRQTCITKDNAPIDIDFLIYMKVVQPEATVIAVGDFHGAARGIATTTLRAVVGDIPLDDVLAKREEINKVLRAKLDESTERWGVKVTTVEIREISTPPDVQDAMTKQMSAERERRATVTTADGAREAAVMVAQGEKDAAILTAEGERRARALRAEGYALALKKIFEVAEGLDEKTMALQYLDALKAMSEGPATKFIFPMEFTKLVEPFVGKMGNAR